MARGQLTQLPPPLGRGITAFTDVTLMFCQGGSPGITKFYEREEEQFLRNHVQS